jgi:hypothetical protein
VFLVLCFEERCVRYFTFLSLQNTQALAFAKFEKEQWELHFSNVSWEDFQNETVKRQLRVLSVLGVSALNDEELSEVSRHCINGFLKEVSH